MHVTPYGTGRVAGQELAQLGCSVVDANACGRQMSNQEDDMRGDDDRQGQESPSETIMVVITIRGLPTGVHRDREWGKWKSFGTDKSDNQEFIRHPDGKRQECLGPCNAWANSWVHVCFPHSRLATQLRKWGIVVSCTSSLTGGSRDSQHGDIM